MQNAEDLDPRRILLNKAGFRTKFHIYEIAQSCDRATSKTIYVVRKQLLAIGSTSVMQEIVMTEKFAELQVSRGDVAEIYYVIRDLALPVSRTGHRGKDGTCYGLQIGAPPCSTTIRWWSDGEPELRSIYQLRDNFIKTVNRLLRTQQATQVTSESGK